MTARRGAEGGFTLLEVVVAMALFAAGIVAIYQLYSGALRLAAGSRDASASSIYARQRMEEALLVPDPAEGVERGMFGDRYRWEVETSFLPRQEETSYDGVRVRVTVAWKDGGDERAVDLFATRWGWRGEGGGDLSAGSTLAGSASASAGSTWQQPGFLPKGGGGQPMPPPGGGGREAGMQGDDYIRSTRRRR